MQQRRPKAAKKRKEKIYLDLLDFSSPPPEEWSLHLQRVVKNEEAENVTEMDVACSPQYLLSGSLQNFADP